MNEPDWKGIAKNLVQDMNQQLEMQVPKGYSIMLYWKEGFYVGSLQHIAPEYSNEIVLLSKSSRSIPEELKDAILQEDSERETITAGVNLNLEGRLQIFRKVEGRLLPMTSDQLVYMRNMKIEIGEKNTGDVTSESKTHLYHKGREIKPEEN